MNNDAGKQQVVGTTDRRSSFDFLFCSFSVSDVSHVRA